MKRTTTQPSEVVKGYPSVQAFETAANRMLAQGYFVQSVLVTDDGDKGNIVITWKLERS